MDRKPAPRAERRRLTHVDRSGRPRMVDVSGKPATARRAVAEAFVACSAETLSLVIDGVTPKGDVLSVAELAGVMAGKRTSDLIPLCHPIGLTDLLVQVVPDRVAGGLRIRAEAATVGSTGVEMEALTAASVAALTVWRYKNWRPAWRSDPSGWSRRPAARAATGFDQAIGRSRPVRCRTVAGRATGRPAGLCPGGRRAAGERKRSAVG